jgi:hypothetical protein
VLGPRCRSSLARVVALGGAGPPLLFVVGACGPSLPFVFGVRHCRLLLAHVVAVFHWRALLLFAVGACRCLGARSLFVGGRSSSSVGGALSSVDGGRCCPWGVIVVMDGALLWSVGAHCSGGGSLLSRGVGDSVPAVRIEMGGLTNGRRMRFVVHRLVATSPMATWHLGCGSPKVGGKGGNKLTLDGDNVVRCHRQKAPRRRCCWGWLW